MLLVQLEPFVPRGRMESICTSSAIQVDILLWSQAAVLQIIGANAARDSAKVVSAFVAMAKWTVAVDVLRLEGTVVALEVAKIQINVELRGIIWRANRQVNWLFGVGQQAKVDQMGAKVL